MAQVDCAGPLQLLCGTRKPRQSGRVPGADTRALATCTSPPNPAPVLLDTCPRSGCTLASRTASTPSLSCRSLRRQSSAIRTGCANERPSGSVRGAISNGCPYRDLIATTIAAMLPPTTVDIEYPLVYSMPVWPPAPPRVACARRPRLSAPLLASPGSAPAVPDKALQEEHQDHWLRGRTRSQHFDPDAH